MARKSTRYIQSWKLDAQQTIHLSKYNKIIFRHCTSDGTKYRGVSVHVNCLQSVKDFGDLVTKHNSYMKIPIDDKVWIQYSASSSVKMYVCSPKRHDLDYRFFRFSDYTWKRFIKSVLPDIISFVGNGAYRTDGNCQPHDEVKSRGRIPRLAKVENETSKSREMDHGSKEAETYDEFATRQTYDVDMEDVEEGEIVEYPILS